MLQPGEVHDHRHVRQDPKPALHQRQRQQTLSDAEVVHLQRRDDVFTPNRALSPVPRVVPISRTLEHPSPELVDHHRGEPEPGLGTPAEPPDEHRHVAERHVEPAEDHQH